MLALVTWVQRDDPHWFGARIPDVSQSVDFVQVAAGGLNETTGFAGTRGAEDQTASSFAWSENGGPKTSPPTSSTRGPLNTANKSISPRSQTKKSTIIAAWHKMVVPWHLALAP